MNVHAAVDRMTALVGGWLAGQHRFFADDLDGAPLTEVVRATRIPLPPPAGEGIYEADAHTPAGILDPAYRVARWLGPTTPTLLYLQGSGERPFDFSAGAKNTFRTVVLDAEPPWAANLVVVRAPYHRGSPREYARAMGRLGRFTGMLASLVVTAEELVGHLHEAGSGPVVLSGISLGGWGTNLHAALFGTADAYAPLLAGTALAELFLDSSYRRLTGRHALDRPERVRRVLNFEGIFAEAAPQERVFPLLARHDQFIRFPRQKASYAGVPVADIPRGHVTAALSPSLLRRHLERVLASA